MSSDSCTQDNSSGYQGGMGGGGWGSLLSVFQINRIGGRWVPKWDQCPRFHGLVLLSDRPTRLVLNSWVVLMCSNVLVGVHVCGFNTVADWWDRLLVLDVPGKLGLCPGDQEPNYCILICTSSRLQLVGMSYLFAYLFSLLQSINRVVFQNEFKAKIFLTGTDCVPFPPHNDFAV